MAERVVLHIGPRKTATTYLQRIMQQLVRDRLIPGRSYPLRTRGRMDHNHVPGLIDLARSVGDIRLQGDAWTHQDGSDAQALLRAVSASPHDVLLSAEAMSVLDAPTAHALVAAFSPARVEVVITIRALDRVIPSSWQQHIRNGNHMLYAEYLESITHARDVTDDSEGFAFWRAYRYPDLVCRWREAAASVTVVTVPATSSDPALTWRRFREAIALPDLPEEPPAITDERANVSLTGAESFVLAALNEQARARGEDRRQVRAMHRQLLRDGWTERPDRGGRLGLPADMREQVQDWIDEDIAGLRGMSPHVIGDLEELRAHPDLDPGLPDADDIARALAAT